MADYSIDDILAELDAKKSGSASSEDIDDILGGDYSEAAAEYEEETAEEQTEEAAYKEEAPESLYGETTEVDKVLAQTDLFAISDGESSFAPATEVSAPEEVEEDEILPVAETEEQRIAREKKEAENRELLLKKERENTNPDDMLDLINPLEVKEKAISEVKEKELAPVAELSSMYAGNTQGIAGGDLKAIAPVKAPVGERITDEEDRDVKEYPSKNDNSGLIESLNKTIEAKRTADIKAHRTITLTEIKGKSDAVAHPLNIDYKKQIIESTGALPEENPVIRQEKLAELSAEKKHKLKDFVLEDDYDSADEEADEEEEEEFTDYDSTGQIWADLCASHKGLKVRMILLGIITAFVLLVGALNDLELFTALSAGESFGFINRLGDVNSLIFMYLICGILGFAVCSTALSNGIIKLFTGKADCDTVCAVTAAFSLIGGVVALIDVQSFRLAHGFIYVGTALVSLLFNTAGKLYMIVRAKRNFRFVSGDSQKYYAQIIENEASASLLTKGISDRVPVVAVMRKTEFLSDFLRSSYCDDEADRLSAKLAPLSIVLGLVAGLFAYFNPFGSQFSIHVQDENPLCWAVSAAVAVISLAAPFSVLLIINRPLNTVSRQLGKTGAVLLGYEAAKEFSDANTVLVDAKALFPAGSAVMRSMKCCQKKNAVTKVNIDEAILMAASLAIHTDGILAYAFYDVTLGDKELLKKVDNCIYEDNSGVTGWIGARRVMFGGRSLMKTHHIDLPVTKNERKHCATADDEVVYLAVGGEIVAMFIIAMTANSEIKSCLQSLQKRNIAISVRTTDSIVTVEKLADLFELDPELITVLPHEAHEEFEACTKYTSRGNGGLSCNGTFTSLARGILAAKTLMRDFALSKAITLCGAALGVVLGLMMIVFKQTFFITPTMITLYNTAAALIMLAVQKTRKY